MAKLPCIHCGKIIDAVSGLNTVYYPPDGNTYACCSGGCKGEGAYDTKFDWARIKQMSEDQRLKHRVPPEDSSHSATEMRPTISQLRFQPKCLACSSTLDTVEALGLAMEGGQLTCKSCGADYNYRILDGRLTLKRTSVPSGSVRSTEETLMPLFDSVGQTSDPDRIVSFTTSKAGRKPAADGLVPCPICKVGVKPANLESHKTKCTILERARKKQRAERREELNRRSQEIQEHREEEARHREEEDASTKAEEEGRAQVQARRKSDGRCVMCGNPLGFFQRLLGKDRHGPCTEFRD